METRGLSPVVIGCTGGSGSRALRDILEASPKIFLDQACSPNSKDSKASKSFLEMKDAPAEVRRPLLEAFVQFLLAQIPEGEENRYQYFGWKNPRNLHHLDLLMEVHPELRFLHLVRNPAAIAAGSLWKKGQKRAQQSGWHMPKENPELFLLVKWAHQNFPVWQKYQSHPRYRLVRYEDLLTKSTETIHGLFAWLGVAEYDLDKALAVLTPSEDALTRGSAIDLSLIAEAVTSLGYPSAAAS
jgi:hypothetical protein